ncbi:MAG: hypothetical protein QHH74_11400 [Spirochaetota bacterium]|nr:hypothetical protein [Spirochaetota bacterium]
MKKIVYVVVLLLLLCNISAFAKDFLSNQDSRDRFIRLEVIVDEGFKSTNIRIDNLRDDIKDIKTFMLWGFGILFSGMGILIGFVLWDRRTALAPVIKRYEELEERQEKIEHSLKELAIQDKKVGDTLRKVGLL